MEELKKQVRRDKNWRRKTVALYKTKHRRSKKKQEFNLRDKLKNRFSGNLAADMLTVGVLIHSFKFLMLGV